MHRGISSNVLIAAVVLAAVATVGTLAAESGVDYSSFTLTKAAVGEPKTEPPSVTSVAEYTNGQVKCTQVDSCEYYSDILLVIKLNPVRLLWLDPLLNMYGAGFKHIVFYSTLRIGDKNHHKYVRVGSRDVKVHLIDDNTGFCDHYNIALEMERHPDFAGYIYLTDDLYWPFWRQVGWDKTKVWRQYLTKNPPGKVGPAESAAIKEITEMFPDTADKFVRPPFAATSGMYYVPKTTSSRFIPASRILLKHKTYNEWGTPILLSAVDNGEARWMKGRLVWNNKRLFVRRGMRKPFDWYHPLRVSSEAFTRLLHMIQTSVQTNRTFFDADGLFEAKCLDCATFPVNQRSTKGLYHSCVVLEDNMAPCEETAPRFNHQKVHWPQLKETTGIGGYVYVDAKRQGIPSPLEHRHEGFWNKEVSLFIFDEFYPMLNRTHFDGRSIRGYPECCTQAKK